VRKGICPSKRPADLSGSNPARRYRDKMTGLEFIGLILLLLGIFLLLPIIVLALIFSILLFPLWVWPVVPIVLVLLGLAIILVRRSIRWKNAPHES